VAATGTDLPPNHRDKRERIVAAARSVLLRDGPAACTSRTVARESGLNKGLIHYYFSTMEEIVDSAMASLLDDLVARLRETAPAYAHLPAEQRFAKTIEEYLAANAEQEGLSLLWFDYWSMCLRAGRREIVEAIYTEMAELIESLLTDAGVPDPSTRARVLMSYVIGTLVRAEVREGTLAELGPELDVLTAS